MDKKNWSKSATLSSQTIKDINIQTDPENDVRNIIYIEVFRSSGYIEILSNCVSSNTEPNH